MMLGDDICMDASDEDIKKHDARFKHILKDSKKQSSKFIETATALGCDESEAAFNDKLKKMVRPEKAKDNDNG